MNASENGIVWSANAKIAVKEIVVVSKINNQTIGPSSIILA
jgi:hypothetical protein